MADENKELEKDTLFTEEEILDHDYDGIKELNNDMPFWLQGLFALTIIFGFIYYIHYTSESGPTLYEEYLKDKEAHASLLASKKSKEENVDFKAMLNNEEGLQMGAKVFTLRCESCHGNALQGGIGPNLTDKYWLHGGSHDDITKVISEGVAAKGMPAWGQLLSKKEIVAVTLFIESKIGSNPSGAKAPQGELVE